MSEELALKKVMVILSSYNGAKFIKEQINSILNQKGVNVSLLVNLALLFTIPTALMILYFSFNLGELSSVMEKTYNIIYIIALTSLIIFIPYVLLGILDAPTLFPFLRNNWTQYAPSFYIYSYPQGNRNCAFFYEAPKYNVILTLALAYSCYIKKECLLLENS